MADVFISYGSHNKPFAKKLAEEIVAYGYTTFFDGDIYAGENYRERIDKELENARVVLGILDEETCNTQKHAFAVSECISAYKTGKLIPILIEGATNDDLPRELSSIHCLDMTDDDGSGFRPLVRAINRHLDPARLRKELAEEDRAANPRPLISESTTAEATNVRTILDDFSNEVLRVPDYQRESNQWDLKIKSLFIESIINNLAIPAFFFEPKIEPRGEVNYIVDGQQRVTTLFDYKSNKFPLLPAGEVPYISPNLTHYAGRTYDELPRVYQDAFGRYRLTIIKLRDLGEQRLEVFRRINQGGTPLSAQDIRLAYYGERSKAVTFTRLTGLLHLASPTTKTVFANAQTKWQRAAPWTDAAAFEKWQRFWSDGDYALGQKASEMFLCCLLSANFKELSTLVAQKAKYPHLQDAEAKTIEGVLDLYCTQLAHQEANKANNALFGFDHISKVVFPVFQDFVKNQFGHTHIHPSRARHLGICAGSMCRAGIIPSGLKEPAWSRIANFLWKPREVAKKHKIAWQENKGIWSGTKSWSTQISAMHAIIPKLC